MNNITRMELMQKLSRSDRPAIDLPMAPMFVAGSLAATQHLTDSLCRAGSGPTSLRRRPRTCTSAPIPCATCTDLVALHSMLKDAFDPEEETERDWDIDLRDDVKSEVESKYGKVSEIFVVKESQVRALSLVHLVDVADTPNPRRERSTSASILLKPLCRLSKDSTVAGSEDARSRRRTRPTAFSTPRSNLSWNSNELVLRTPAAAALRREIT